MDDIYRSLVDPNLAIGPFVFSAGLLRLENDYSKASFPLLLMNQPIGIQDQIVIVQASNSPYEAFFRRSAYFSELSTPEARAAARLNLGLPSSDDITDLEAALTAGIAAAAASAATATTQAGIATDAVDEILSDSAAGLAAINAAAASGLAAIASYDPVGADLRVGMRKLDNNVGGTPQADGTILSSAPITCQMQSLTADLLAAQAAGTPVSFFVRKKSGAVASNPSVILRTVFANTLTLPLTLQSNGYYVGTAVIPGGVDNLQYSIIPSGSSRFDYPSYAIGPAATVSTEQMLLAQLTRAITAQDNVVEVPISTTQIAGFNFVANSLTIDGAFTFADFQLWNQFGQGEFGVFEFENIGDKAPMQAALGQCAVRAGVSADRVGGPLPELIEFAPNCYRILFQASWNSPTDDPWYGIRLGGNNITGLVPVLTNFHCWKGKNVPAHSKASAPIHADAVATAKDYIAREVQKTHIYLIGDSTFRLDNLTQPTFDSLLAAELGDDVVIHNLAVASNTGAQALVTAGVYSVPVNVTGGAIPTTGGVVITPTGNVPTNSYTASNFDLDRIWRLGGVEGIVLGSGSAGGNLFATYTFYRLKDGPAVTVADGTNMRCKQGLEAKRGYVISRLAFNSPGTARADTAAVAAYFGAERCLLIPQACLRGDSVAAPTTLATQIEADNPGRMFDLNTPVTPTERTWLVSKGWAPSADDDVKIAASQWPYGLNRTADNVHRNTFGLMLEARRIRLSAQMQADVLNGADYKHFMPKKIRDILAIAPAANDIIQYVGGVWTNRTPAQVRTSMGL